jgi:hypothetical protein
MRATASGKKRSARPGPKKDLAGERARGSMLWIALLASVLGAMAPAAQGLEGTFLLLRDSDGSKPKPDATVTLTFGGGTRGPLSMSAVQPGETVTDTGSFSAAGGRITITFKEMEWEAKGQPYQFDGCTLTLPFKALNLTPGAGTSTWVKRDPKCQASGTAEPQAGAAAPAGSAPAGKFGPFSADVLVTDGSEHSRAKIFAAQAAVRTEGEDAGQKSVMILRFDRKVLWRLTPQSRTYTETGLDAGSGPPLMMGGGPGCVRAGEERVGSYTCVKEECRVSSEKGEQPSTQWAAKELGGLVVKFACGKNVIEYQNVKPGPQDAALFEIPAGYRKVGE